MSGWLTHFFIWVCRGLSYLPWGLIVGLSNGVGFLLWHLAVPRRKIALRNLELCFPEWTLSKREEVAKAHFRAFVRSFFDRFVLWHHPEAAVKNFVRIEGLEIFQKHLGRPMILLAPHFLGMDAGGMRLQMEAGMASMYAKQKNEVFNEEMTQGRMRFNGATMLLRTDGIRPALRLIKNGMPFYLLPDMDLGDRDALFVPFFGVEAATVTSMARLAAAAKAVVIPVVTHLTDTGYMTTVHPAWEDYPGDDIAVATLKMNQFIESEVLKFPEQYLWTHKRFKTRPAGEASVYSEL
jgi:Kdo2-lipid IVA lauroyltransferase/acyltransferase